MLTSSVIPGAWSGLSRRLVKRTRQAAGHVRHRANQVRHLRRRPPLSAIGRHIIAELRRDGVAAVPLEALPFASNPALFDAMPRVCQHLDRLDPDAASTLEYKDGFEHCVPINPSKIATDFPELFMWGLDESLLDIVESCIGLDVAYHGVCARKEIVDGRSVGTRLWHRDGEDHDVIRVLIYLSDVLDDESGPFEYVPRHSSPTYRDFHGIDEITDEEMRRVVPEWRWRRVKAPRGTVVFGAVAKIFHHGRIPRSARKLASFCYTSRHPKDEVLCRAFSFESGIPFLNEPLSDRQRACLWKYQELLPAPGLGPARAAPVAVSPRPKKAVVVAPRPSPAPLSRMAIAVPASPSLAPSELT
ncbi:Hypothetical protein I5071_73380 [Sandaracinus amylolyticus]|nr:Hypothetical protein I5071_73380 [Sandaracinus amylolyticus]